MKKICIIGGGHGTGRLIKGFINRDVNVDIVITSSDNGGYTGELLKEFEVPALGDLRMVLESLLNGNLLDIFSYRFKNLHGKNNVSLGNLILLSFVLEHGSVNGMLNKINKMIDSKFKLHLSNDKYVELKAITKEGKMIEGEVNIGECDNIDKLYLSEDGIVDDKVISAIKESDVIVLSFGSFYTSLGASLVSNKIRKAIKESGAKIVYIPNLVNQKETKNYLLENYIDFIEETIERRIDRVLISSSKIKKRILKRYKNEGSNLVVNEEHRDNYEYYPFVVIEDNKLRHDVDYLAEIILND